MNWIQELRTSERISVSTLSAPAMAYSFCNGTAIFSLLSFLLSSRAAPHKPGTIVRPNTDSNYSPSPHVFHFLPFSMTFPSTPSSPCLHTLPHIKSHNEAHKLKLTKLFSEFLQSFPLRNTATWTHWQNGSAMSQNLFQIGTTVFEPQKSYQKTTKLNQGKVVTIPRFGFQPSDVKSHKSAINFQAPPYSRGLCTGNKLQGQTFGHVIANKKPDKHQTAQHPVLDGETSTLQILFIKCV